MTGYTALWFVPFHHGLYRFFRLLHLQAGVYYIIKSFFLQPQRKTQTLYKIMVYMVYKKERHKNIWPLGYYTIMTSEIIKNDREIIDKYHGLSRVEDSFRITGSDLEGRPVYIGNRAKTPWMRMAESGLTAAA